MATRMVEVDDRAWLYQAEDDMAEFARSLGLTGAQPESGVDLDVWIDVRLEAIARVQAEMAHNADVAARRMKMLADWRDEQNAVLARRAEYLTRQIEEVARAYPYPAGKKSRKLAFGEIGLRAERPRLEVTDEAAALEFVRGVPELAPDAIRVKESLALQ